MRAKCRLHERRKLMKDNMKEKDLTVDFFFGNEEINPFDAPQMCVVRRLSNAYHELENEKLPANKAEINLRIAKLSFYEELIDISIQTDFSQADIIALYEEEDLAEIAWLFWNDVKCPVTDVLLLIAKLAYCDEISDKVIDSSNCQAKCNSLVEKVNRRNKVKTLPGAIVNQIKNSVKALS